MNSEHNDPVIIVVQSLCDWFTSLGGIIPALLVLLGLTTLVWMFFVFRAIRRGGLKPQSIINFSRRQQMTEQFGQQTKSHE